MGLTLKRRGKIYYLRGTVAGQRVYESTGLDDRAAADLVRTRREQEIVDRVTLGTSASLTFAEAALTYLETGGEARFLRPLLEHFGPRTRLTDIDNDQVARAARALYPNAAPATVNRQVITPISAVYQLAADEGKVSPRRFRRRKPSAARTRWLTPAEAERLIEVCDQRLRPMVMTLLGTGCRTSELFRMTAEDLHLGTSEAWVGQAKNGEARMVRYPARTRRALITADLPELGALFRTPKGKPYAVRQGRGGQIEAAFGQARAAAGLGDEVTPHVLRHTWATWHWSQNRDLLELMRSGGWKKSDVAMAYTKLAPADLGEQLLANGWDFRPHPVGQERPDAKVPAAGMRVVK
ncbi:tyrosine-type recombinase/integrase [Maritimibacter alexandrii]|uniref:tyrosine-type recombinase/integrase n=1 Tax=Maritimibacter alexandrii TaxID=2570355 RepID=UPI0011094FF9|nr:tyrosine-type recombinase/integrase [Maritimibacter alexandrii]